MSSKANFKWRWRRLELSSGVHLLLASGLCPQRVNSCAQQTTSQATTCPTTIEAGEDVISLAREGTRLDFERSGAAIGWREQVPVGSDLS